MTLRQDAKKFGKQVTDKLNTVVLGFEAFEVDALGVYRQLCTPEYSNPINNLKVRTDITGKLNI